MQLNFASASKNKLKWILAIMAIHGCLAMGLTIGFIPDKTDQMDRSVYKHNEPWGTMQKSEVNKQTFRSWIQSRIGSRNTWEYIFFTSLNHQLFKNTAYFGYFWHFVISCICVFVYLTARNISFDVLGPWTFQKI